MDFLAEELNAAQAGEAAPIMRVYTGNVYVHISGTATGTISLQHRPTKNLPFVEVLSATSVGVHTLALMSGDLRAVVSGSPSDLNVAAAQ